jgi:sugar phosphate isomerase/epimerase
VRVGIDTYSFHRNLGALRPGEAPTPVTLRLASLDTIEHAARFGVDVIAAQTCFLPPTGTVDVESCATAARPAELVPSWGAPDGLEYGGNAAARSDLEWWIVAAAHAGCRLLRIVLGGPALYGREPDDIRTERTLPVLEDLARLASSHGLTLAIENHGDTTAEHLASILGRLRHESVGICFDTANALRAGDDPVAAARLLEQWVVMLHLKDVEPLDRQLSHVSGPCSVPFGEGVVDLEGVLRALHGPITRGAPVCLELGQLPDSADEDLLLRSGIDWLRSARSADLDR